ncbi:Scr1 family TA system antitoxin-like transcriptional regulator [Kitasatospora herbaricolor]|uniref:Scr1 family TA system antitoxin-like transcriptional regulator n=1 Tax=Kitasatospora herbaricolor TaxID=68217 RepID=A0ABZ1WEH1_9ACTN|nr:Scr1 family TA system antitoxin-like transcriptional regulator [Kitasatospora herbaricolor]
MTGRKPASPPAPPSPPLRASAGSVFGGLVRRTREARGMSQGDVAKLIPCSRPHLTRVESGTRVPQRNFVTACDRIFGTGSELLEIWEEIDWYVPVEHPDWFQRYARIEAQATMIQEFNVARISGLLQTERYARALFSHGDAAGDPQLVEERVAARLSRQQRITNADGPLFIAVLAEAAVRQVVGGAEVMYEQLQHLLDVGRLPNVVIQVAPFSLGERVPFGTFTSVVVSPDGRRRVYSESLDRGHFVEDPKEVRRYQRAYDLLRADALSVRESAQLIRSVMRGLLNMATPVPDLSAAPWRKSTYSDNNGGACVEVADDFPGLVPVRDSKDPDGPALVFRAEAWSSFVDAVKTGGFPAA